MTYAIVKTGGKQYRVEAGQRLLVERLPAGEGDKVALQPLLYRGDDEIVDAAAELEKVKVEAKVLAHERGPKLRVFKFKPKRGYRKRTGHRQELTRIEVTEIRLLSRRPARKKADSEPAKAESKAAEPAAAEAAAAEDKE